MSGGGEIIIRNGDLKTWWNTWIRYYDVILFAGVKVRAWRLLAGVTALLMAASLTLGAVVG